MKNSKLSIFFGLLQMPLHIALQIAVVQSFSGVAIAQDTETTTQYTRIYADDIADEPAARNDLHMKSATSVAFQTGRFEYKEPGHMKYGGPMNGVAIGYDHVTYSGYLVQVQADYMTGALQYDGQTWGGTKLTAKTADSITEVRGLFGSPKFMSDDLRSNFNPYAGLGYRLLQNKMEGLGSYAREISYIYIPVGATLEFAMGDSWIANLNAEFDLFLSGKVTSHFEDVDRRLPTTENPQTGGYGARASVGLEKNFASFALRLSPYVQYWNIDESKPARLYGTTGVIEPANNSTMTGVNVALEM